VSEQIQIERIENQLTRMENSLRTALSSASPPSWIIVVGHYPIFSAGDHGDIDEMKSYLLPLLLKYNVHAYICGHDHISEHLTYSNMSFYVVGAGSMTDSMKRTSSAELVQSIAGQKIKVIAALPDWDIKALNISSLYKYIYIDPIASATTNHSSQRDNPS
jgi:3',5'-cyclic AMP phosphodiesterase CpdA